MSYIVLFFLFHYLKTFSETESTYFIVFSFGFLKLPYCVMQLGTNLKLQCFNSWSLLQYIPFDVFKFIWIDSALNPTEVKLSDKNNYKDWGCQRNNSTVQVSSDSVVNCGFGILDSQEWQRIRNASITLPHPQ